MGIKHFVSFAFVMLFGLAAHAHPVVLSVDFKDEVSPRQVSQLEHQYALHVQHNSVMWSRTKLGRIVIDSSEEEQVIKELKDSKFVDIVEEEETVSLLPEEAGFQTWDTQTAVGIQDGGPNDPLYREGKQWNMTMIGVEKAWKTTRGRDVVVAVLDTGVSDGNGSQRRVPDLAQTKFVPGYNFVDDNTDAYDGNAHGTHVAGTIAQSTNNGIGVVGIAFEAEIMPVKVLSDEGSGSTTDIADAIEWATDNGANVINMSLGGGGHSAIFAKAVKYAADNGVFVACAAGNSGRGHIEYPAAYPGCHAVSSVGKSGELAFYSSYGTNGQGVFIAAPGGDQKADGQEGGIWQNTISPGNPAKHGYFPFQGTSMATPHVAGVAALVISVLGADHYELKDVETALASSAIQKSDRARYGSGLMNADAAVSKAVQLADSNESNWRLKLTIGVILALAVILCSKKLGLFN